MPKPDHLISPTASNAPDREVAFEFTGIVEKIRIDNRRGSYHVSFEVSDDDVEFVTRLRHVAGHDVTITLHGDPVMRDLLTMKKTTRSRAQRKIEEIKARKAIHDGED